MPINVLTCQVQAAHVPCNSNVATCICAIAVREGNDILGIDMCKQGIQLFTYRNGELPDGTGIYRVGSGYTVTPVDSQHVVNIVFHECFPVE